MTATEKRELTAEDFRPFVVVDRRAPRRIAYLGARRADYHPATKGRTPRHAAHVDTENTDSLARFFPWKHVVGYSLAVLLTFGVGQAVGEARTTPDPWTELVASAEPTISGDGVWLVGEEIEPGTYQAQGSREDCYWARLSDPDGDRLESIIINYVGPAETTVDIKSNDVAFETLDCGTWIRV